MTLEELERCGEALYGPRWRSDLARDLGYSIGVINLISRGTRPVPVYMRSKWANPTDYLFRDAIINLMQQRIDILTGIIKDVQR